MTVSTTADAQITFPLAAKPGEVDNRDRRASTASRLHSRGGSKILRRVPQLTARFCAVGLLALIAVEVHLRGSIRHSPSTVISNAYFPLRAAEPFLLFLEEVARRVPEGDRVVVLSGEDALLGSGYLGPRFLFGLSQLPGQVVLPEDALKTHVRGRSLWVACFGRSFADERFRPVGSFLGGTLFQETP